MSNRKLDSLNIDNLHLLGNSADIPYIFYLKVSAFLPRTNKMCALYLVTEVDDSRLRSGNNTFRPKPFSPSLPHQVVSPLFSSFVVSPPDPFPHSCFAPTPLRTVYSSIFIHSVVNCECMHALICFYCQRVRFYCHLSCKSAMKTVLVIFLSLHFFQYKNYL